MTQQTPWPPWSKIAVVGAGAVGGYFGGMLARAGASVIMIGRPAFVDAGEKNGLTLDTLHLTKTFASTRQPNWKPRAARKSFCFA